MRTIDRAVDEIKQSDPNSAVTRNGLRTLVATGAIPSVRVGVKYLVNMADVNHYFGGPDDEHGV